MFRRRVPRPTAAEEDDHSTGTETSLPGSWMHFVVGKMGYHYSNGHIRTLADAFDLWLLCF